jgi:hypothetical protein
VNTRYAAIWSGTADSFVNLNPVGADSSEVYATTGSQQAGVAGIGGVDHAGLWFGTAASFVDLHPTASGAISSSASGATGTQQSGSVYFPGSVVHAALWSGTPGSFVDLNPLGAVHSSATAITSTFQVGWAVGATTGTHAGIWSGTPESFVDLDDYLDNGYGDSAANGIWTDGSIILVSGRANNLATGMDDAILWTITPVPEPGVVSLAFVASFTCAAGFLVRRKRGTTRLVEPTSGVGFAAD